MAVVLTNPLERLARIAEAELGNAEEPRGSNRGAAIQKYFEADAYTPNKADNGYAWCACFVSWCVQRFLASAEGADVVVRPPRLSAAFSFRDWGKANGCLVLTPGACNPAHEWPKRGDIVVYTFSHVGIVTSVSAKGDRVFSAVEGNTDENGGREGWEVARRARTFGNVLCFVRMSPKGKEVG